MPAIQKKRGNALQRLLILILLWCSVNTFGEVLIKLGSRSLSELNSVSGIPSLVWEVVQNPLMLVGILISAADLLLWIYILKCGDLGMVVPLTAINYVFALIVGCVLFNEVITMNRVVGILFIFCGTYFISR